MENYLKRTQGKRILAGILTVIMILASIDLSPFVFVQASTEYDTLYLIDNTAQKWVKNDNANIKAIDNSNGHTEYWMTQKDENTWSVKIPKNANNITFKRYDRNKTIQWNSWNAGDRNKNNAYYADVNEYGHWGIMEENEKCFHAGDIIYLDVSEFTHWENDNALIYVNFTNASKNENHGNDVWISSADKKMYNPRKVENKIGKNIYQYIVTQKDEGSTKLRFWRGNAQTLWNYSSLLSYDEYASGSNCVRITNWNTGKNISQVPTEIPTQIPTAVPTEVPTQIPTAVPTDVPTQIPTTVPTDVPTQIPTAVPTDVPTQIPTTVPTDVPTRIPTAVPTDVPTQIPTAVPTDVPTQIPTAVPTQIPAYELITEEDVYESIIKMKKYYPQGMPWTNANLYNWNGGIYGIGGGCAGFAFLLSDAAFNTLPARKHKDFSNIKVGDIIRMNNDGHSVIALQVDEYNVVVAEGNLNGVIRWGRRISRKEIEKTGTYILTRYPLNPKEIYRDIIKMKEQYPEGMPWTDSNSYRWNAGNTNVWSGNVEDVGYGCTAFAFLLSDAAFGNTLKARRHKKFSDIKVGDILRINNDTHSVIVLEVNENQVVVAEGNYNNSIHWGRTFERAELEKSCNYVLTRYPES